LDSGHELNRNDIEDFILSPTGIQVPSCDKWFRRYALEKLTDAAEILRRIDRRETDYFKSLTNIRNETQGTLNIKCVDILLGFLTNICVSYADKPSNGYGHWKTTRGKIPDGTLKID
jgi:hypothetical protein